VNSKAQFHGSEPGKRCIEAWNAPASSWIPAAGRNITNASDTTHAAIGVRISADTSLKNQT
jgi:hypothetical protein